MLYPRSPFDNCINFEKLGGKGARNSTTERCSKDTETENSVKRGHGKFYCTKKKCLVVIIERYSNLNTVFYMIE